MDGISEQVQRKLEQVFEEATDLAVPTVLAGWDRKTPLHFSKIEENDSAVAEAILQVRAAALCDDDRLTRYLSTWPVCVHVRRSTVVTAA